jgi:hypothetical protein
MCYNVAMAVPGKPAQAFVPIREIRDGVIVLESGELRRVLITSTLNFGLKSADEQMAIIGQFQAFLNGLDFAVQIFIQSKRLDIRPYLKLLEEREKVQLNDAMRIQVHEYINFIREFTGRTNIMSKNFFVVVPMPSLLKAIPSNATEDQRREDRRQFEQARMQLEQRVSVVQGGLGGCDIKTTPLGTEELTELFYKKFNPGELETTVEIK